MRMIMVFIVLQSIYGCTRAQEKTFVPAKEWQLTEAQWKERLSDLEYHVLREKGTERAFTGQLLKNKAVGTYTCKACKLPLFDSETKYNSGTGWPSFWDIISTDNVKAEKDYSYGMIRTEVFCGRCGGHLGHVFPDGPKPTGQRYCINDVSLNFVEKEKKPE